MPTSTRPRRGAGNDTTVTVALSKDVIKSLDEWREKEDMTRDEAMRWIIAEYFKKRAATRVP